MGISLNLNEQAVLRATIEEVRKCTGGEFGYTEDIKVEGISKNSLKGYLSQLVQKGLITSPDEVYHGQFQIRKIATTVINVEGFILVD